MNYKVYPTTNGFLTPVIYPVVRDDTGKQVIPVDASLTISGVPAEGIPVISTGEYGDTEGSVKYEWTTDENDQLKMGIPHLNVRLVWEFELATAQVIERVQYLDVVKFDFSTGIVSADLDAELPDLIRYRAVHSGTTTDTGTVYTLEDVNRLKNQVHNFYQDSLLSISAGPSKQSRRLIVMSDPDTGTIEIDKPLVYPPGRDYGYEIKVGYRAAIVAAWERLFARLVDDFGAEEAGKMAYGGDVRRAHLYESMSIALDTVSGIDRFKPLIADYRARAEQAISRNQIKFGDEPTTRQPIRMWSRFGA